MSSWDDSVKPEEERKEEEDKAYDKEEEKETTRFNGYTEPPVPYMEDRAPKNRRDWVSDYHDQLIPERRGFISDFVYHSRGIMTPTLACMWSAIYILGAAIKREAWVQWYPKPLYPNQYILIIGPAGKVKKTTAVRDIGGPLLKGFRSYITNANVYGMKEIGIIKDKTTPEAMLTAMLPESKQGKVFYLKNADGTNVVLDGKAVPYQPTSEAAIMINELSVMLSKKSYADSMIELLLDLYDAHDEWEWRREGAGTKTLRNLCTSLMGGTTVDGFRSSIPQAAKGDGFLSRTVLVYVPETKRCYPMPFLPYGAPNQEEMTKRLAWVAEHTLGEQRLTSKALHIYEKWYTVFNRRTQEDPTLAGAISRMDVNVLKTALLIKASRYESYLSQDIDEGDILDAIRLVETTYQSVPFMLGQLDDDAILAAVAKAEVYLSQRKRVERRVFLGALRLRTDIATLVVQELVARGEVVVKVGKETSLYAVGRSDEVYEWTESGERDFSFDRIWTHEGYADDIERRLTKSSRKNPRSRPHSAAEILARQQTGVQAPHKNPKKAL